MKKITWLLIPFIMACNEGVGDETLLQEIEKLKVENKTIQESANSKDAAIDEFFRGYNEIEENLRQIKEKEKILSDYSKGTSEMGKVNQEQIVADIQAIQELLQKNKNRLSSVSQKLKEANLKIFEMEKTIERLADQIQTKDAQIASLQEQLIKLNGELEYLFNEYNERVAEAGAKDDELNTAWYAFGTAKELKENGVITKEGGVIGIGKTKKLKEDFNKNYFTKIDIREVTSIPLQAKSASILTTHSPKSYKIEGNGRADKLVITDIKEFWNSSKYLVVVVE
ncbi:MAG: hypothetical protein HND27_08275 [Bacteroidetes bacterium]|nr:hypothetical protein [Bacteroidota bacterium]MBV6461672.1 hypothetical protein [Flavobacteriales bacterium]WKZ74150.1 MAG: hypothetical protein QY303_08315 [Vicingaceae bacterium]MCL4816823.1 hypothetical protein [Flavobacteriales bacterium]NOG95761.1 hypothetical protein [Bacteroidota bacterium]